MGEYLVLPCFLTGGAGEPTQPSRPIQEETLTAAGGDGPVPQGTQCLLLPLGGWSHYTTAAAHPPHPPANPGVWDTEPQRRAAPQGSSLGVCVSGFWGP